MKTAEIIAVAVAAILTLAAGITWNEASWLVRAGFIMGILSATLVAVNSFRQNRKERLAERVSAKFGDLKNREDAFYPILQIGRGDRGARLALLNGGVLTIKQFGPLLKLYVRNNKLYLHTVLRNLKGEVIAVIDENTWTLFSNDYEYNNDNQAFELVTKGERNIHFQLELKNGAAHITGFLLNDKGAGCYFFSIPGHPGGFTYILPTPEALEKLPRVTLPPLFKYPREKYHGVRAQ